MLHEVQLSTPQHHFIIKEFVATVVIVIIIHKVVVINSIVIVDVIIMLPVKYHIKIINFTIKYWYFLYYLLLGNYFIVNFFKYQKTN